MGTPISLPLHSQKLQMETRKCCSNRKSSLQDIPGPTIDFFDHIICRPMALIFDHQLSDLAASLYYIDLPLFSPDFKDHPKKSSDEPSLECSISVAPVLISRRITQVMNRHHTTRRMAKHIIENPSPTICGSNGEPILSGFIYTQLICWLATRFARVYGECTYRYLQPIVYRVPMVRTPNL